MQYTRLIKRYMIGDDVSYVKNKLLELGYLKSAKLPRYGNDSYRAVRKFQQDNKLKVDGIVGPKTWAALFAEKPEPAPVPKPEPQPTPPPSITIPSHIGTTAAKAIEKDLATVSAKRRQVVLEALNWAIDPYNNPERLYAFYIRGGNLYNKDLKPNIMTKAKLEKYFARQSYAPYWDNGRDDMMREMCEKYGYEMGGCDCSGFVVGVWRKLKIQGSGFDANANSLYGRYCTTTSKPQPGDLAWRKGHIGIYCGGGYIAECIGGAYGLQLTKNTNRRAYNFQDKRIHKFSPWTAYGSPKKL